MADIKTLLIGGLGTVMLASCTFMSDASNSASRGIGLDEIENESEVPKDWFVSQRAYPHDVIDPILRRQAFETAKAFRRTETTASWSLVGPDNIGGRITGIEASPARPSTVYLASAAGG